MESSIWDYRDKEKLQYIQDVKDEHIVIDQHRVTQKLINVLGLKIGALKTLFLLIEDKIRHKDRALLNKVFSALGKLQSLTRLDIKFNNSYHWPIHKLAKAFYGNNLLEYVKIRMVGAENSVEGTDSVAKALTNLPKLKHLGLDSRSLLPIVPLVLNMTQLRVLELSEPKQEENIIADLASAKYLNSIHFLLRPPKLRLGLPEYHSYEEQAFPFAPIYEKNAKLRMITFHGTHNISDTDRKALKYSSIRKMCFVNENQDGSIVKRIIGENPFIEVKIANEVSNKIGGIILAEMNQIIKPLQILFLSDPEFNLFQILPKEVLCMIANHMTKLQFSTEQLLLLIDFASQRNNILDRTRIPKKYRSLYKKLNINEHLPSLKIPTKPKSTNTSTANRFSKSSGLDSCNNKL